MTNKFVQNIVVLFNVSFRPLFAEIWCFYWISKSAASFIPETNRRISYKKYWMLSETFLVLDWAFSHTMYQRKVDVDMQNAVKSMLADVSSVSPSSEQRELYHRLFTIEIVSFTHWWHSLLLQMRSYLSKNKHNITLDILLSYIFQLSTAMSYLESKNFCHR